MTFDYIASNPPFKLDFSDWRNDLDAKQNNSRFFAGIPKIPNKEKDIPKKVLKLKKIGLSIEWCEDLKSYKKLIPALNKYPNDLIVTADDDIYYPINWLKLLYESYQEQPDLIHCHRAHKIKFDDNQNIMLYNQWERITSNHDASFLVFPTTGGGVIFFPNALNNDVFKENIYLKLSPHADDIWFWAMALINGTRIKVIENNISKILLINGTQETGLWETINATGQNDIQFTNIFNHYGVLKGILFSESKLK